MSLGFKRLNSRTSEGVWTGAALRCGSEPQAYMQKPLTASPQTHEDEYG